MKKRVDSVEVERKYDFYIVKNKNGDAHTVYADDYDMIIKILMEINETKFKTGYISPEAMADKLCELHPNLKSKLLRPTGEYYSKYHLVLKILDFYRYIDYYKDGTVLKHEKFKRMTPKKRGLSKWI